MRCILIEGNLHTCLQLTFSNQLFRTKIKYELLVQILFKREFKFIFFGAYLWELIESKVLILMLSPIKRECIVCDSSNICQNKSERGCIILTQSSIFCASTSKLKELFLCPVINSRTNTPKLYTSAAFDKFPCITYSGAIYPL